MKSRDEVVASFLAVLELIKVNRIAVEDNNGVVEISYLNKKGVEKTLNIKRIESVIEAVCSPVAMQFP